MRHLRLLVVVAIAGCGNGKPRTAGDTNAGVPGTLASARTRADTGVAYVGVDRRGIPNYAKVRLSPEDSTVLRRAYGIEDPHRLYLSDSTAESLLKYDTTRKPCRRCYVNSYRVGYISVRRPGESWEQAERRVRGSRPSTFAGGPVPTSKSTADLDPHVRPLAEAMLRNARAAGFHLRVTATYRSPRHEAFLMAEGGNRTHTLTSNHSYGRALDIVIDNGNARHARTRRDWIAFRRWVTRYRTATNESFRVIGQIDHTWDWSHVELPSATIGFHSIDEAIARGRACLAPHASVPCNFPARVPARLRDALVR